MQWSDVLQDSTLQDLPYKIELDEWGRIVMSPASNKHGYFQMKIGALLETRLPLGTVISECSVQTGKGVKVADVAWCSPPFQARHGFATPYPEAPEICVEILSPFNHALEIEEKVRLYPDAGAREVWLVSEDGGVRYHGRDGELSRSEILGDAVAL